LEQGYDADAPQPEIANIASVQAADSQSVPNIGKGDSEVTHVLDVSRVIVSHAASFDPVGRAAGSDQEAASQENSSSDAAQAGAREFSKAREYVPSWQQTSPFIAPQPRGVRLFLITGLLLVGVVAVLIVVISLKQRSPVSNASTPPVSKPATPAIPDGMILIPGGEFLMGSDRPDADRQERPAHKTTVAPFYIDATEVTCEDYQKFVKATAYKPPAGWVGGNCPGGEPRKPATGVDWYDASAYAKWAHKRLPTEAEWEFAARGATGWIYPWGDQWQKGAANADGAAQGMVVAKTFKGTSPFQCYDMVGNAWEWTASTLVPYPGGGLDQEVSDNLRVIRGGSWESTKDSATTTYRFGWPAKGGKDYSNTSFRCAQDILNDRPLSNH
jgi:formylglycine-generating enzyme required for sulfatase activity